MVLKFLRLLTVYLLPPREVPPASGAIHSHQCPITTSSSTAVAVNQSMFLEGMKRRGRGVVILWGCGILWLWGLGVVWLCG